MADRLLATPPEEADEADECFRSGCAPEPASEGSHKVSTIPLVPPPPLLLLLLLGLAAVSGESGDWPARSAIAAAGEKRLVREASAEAIRALAAESICGETWPTLTWWSRATRMLARLTPLPGSELTSPS